jgi:eukaryotic-like serine/threonine-protein kinase
MRPGSITGNSYTSGTRIGRYRIGWLIGRGACSEIYVAVDERRQLDVAIKVITEPGPLRSHLTRLGREVRTLAEVGHPNVLRVHEFSHYAGLAYLVTDYAPGGSLEDRLGRTLLPISTALSVLGGVAAGLDHLHGLGIVHGDIKPANILFGSAGLPLVADFGVARLPPAPRETPMLRDLTTFMGTPHYMAPEQVRDSPVTPATDVYSLSVLAYRLLTGQLPFVAESSLDVMHMHLLSEAHPASEVRPDLPFTVDSVLAKGMAKDPGARWEACTQLVGELAAAAITHPRVHQRGVA